MKKGKHTKESKYKNKKMAFFRIFLLIVMLVCLIRIGRWEYENIKSKKLLKDVQKIDMQTNINTENANNNEVKEKQNEKFEKLKNINSDVFAYLSVPGTRN